MTGFQFENRYYYDKCLAQGCASFCRIFEQFSVKYMIEAHYSVKNVVKVLDDFLFVGGSFQECLCPSIG